MVFLCARTFYNVFAARGLFNIGHQQRVIGRKLSCSSSRRKEEESVDEFDALPDHHREAIRILIRMVTGLHREAIRILIKMVTGFHREAIRILLKWSPGVTTSKYHADPKQLYSSLYVSCVFMFLASLVLFISTSGMTQANHAVVLYSGYTKPRRGFV